MKYVIGIDYGTDSCRALIVDAITGGEMATAVRNYPRWTEGNYCNPQANQYRQHPLDYLETLIDSVREALTKLDPLLIGFRTHLYDTSYPSGVCPDVEHAQKAMGQGFSKTYIPDGKNQRLYSEPYRKYRILGEFTEEQIDSL
jgi:ribulose kinase